MKFLNELWTHHPRVEGILEGLLVALILYISHRYWSYRSVKSLRRRIKEKESQIFVLDTLANSTEELLLYSFTRIFEIITFVCCAFMLTPMFLYFQRNLTPFTIDIINYFGFIALTWSAFSSASVANTLRRVKKYPKDKETLHQELDSLKSKLPN